MRSKSLWFNFLTVYFYGVNIVLSRYLLVHVENASNITIESQALLGGANQTSQNAIDYYDEEYYSEDGNDYSETGGCKCNCKGECEPKGCLGLTGRRISSRSISGILLYNLYLSLYYNRWNVLQGNP
jgi:hypothetical protein